MTTKVCTKCHCAKPLAEFRKHAKGRYEKRASCAGCTAVAKRRLVLSKYGLTLEQYTALAKKQSGVCAVCGNPPKDRVLDVDHCHTTGKVRGLLCWPCNIAVGHLESLRAPLSTYTTYLGWPL